MRALDGTYWRVKWFTEHNGVWWRSSRYQARGEALEAVSNKLRGGDKRHNVKMVSIRPRMSIGRAGRLLTEARAKGVELWMRSSPEVWGWLSYDDRGWIHMLSDGRAVGFNLRPSLTLAKWIVATPEDARRIDARGKK